MQKQIIKFLKKREKPSKRELKVRKVIGLTIINLLIIQFFTDVSKNTPEFTGIVIERAVQIEMPKPIEIAEAKEKPKTIEDKIRDAFPDDVEHIAIAIAKAESGMRADAVGDGHLTFENGTMGMSCGLFQIRVLEGRPDCETLKDVDTNIAFAKQLFDKSGFRPWSVYKNGTYLKHL